MVGTSYFLVQGHSVVSGLTLGVAYFRDEGTCVDDLEVRGHTGQVEVLGYLHRKLVVFHHEYFVEHIVH